MCWISDSKEGQVTSRDGDGSLEELEAWMDTARTLSPSLCLLLSAHLPHFLAAEWEHPWLQQLQGCAVIGRQSWERGWLISFLIANFKIPRKYSQWPAVITSPSLNYSALASVRKRDIGLKMESLVLSPMSLNQDLTANVISFSFPQESNLKAVYLELPGRL